MDNAIKKEYIVQSLAEMQDNNEKLLSSLSDKCSLRNYAHLARKQQTAGSQ
jgi:hypothetical protein